jgi:hypothetical protein
VFFVCLCVGVMPKKEGLTQPVNIRYSKYVRDRVKEIAADTGLMQAQVFDYVLQGALKALEGEEGLQLPVRLKVDR